MEDGLLKVNGAQEPVADKYTSLATIKFIGGLQTQRSALASIDTRYNTKFLGGKPDALIAGSNVEISNKLTLQRRPGVIAYGVSSIEPPLDFYSWQLATTGDINLIVDTGTSGANGSGLVRNYSPTESGIYINKALGAGQTNFMTVVNTLYFGNGKDLYKIIGPNLLEQSNTFGTGSGTNFSIQTPWTDANVFSLTGGQTDPTGGSNATQLIWSTSGSSAKLEQNVTPNYTPIASNTFTFSLWMKETGGSVSVDIQIADQSGAIATKTCALTATWTKYQITGTMNSNSNIIKVFLQNPTNTDTIVIYGAQLEVGGPATTTQITTTRPQGVYLWGIQAPTSAPLISFTNQVGNTGAPWQPNTAYTVGQTIVDSNGNLEYVLQAGTSGPTQPIWNQQITTAAFAETQLMDDETVSGSTLDGTQNAIIQTNSTFVSASTASLSFQSNVTASNSLMAFIFGDIANTGVTIAVSDSNGNTWSQVQSSISGDQHAYLYTVRSAAAGATTVTVTFSNPAAASIWLAIAEVSDLTGVDVDNSNSARDYSGSLFNTGLITTANADDFIVSFAAFANNTNTGSEIGIPPSSFPLILAAQTGLTTRSGGGHFTNMAAVAAVVSSTVVTNPAWNITNPTTGGNSLVGITAAFKTGIPSLMWINLGTAGAGLSPQTGYQYYYAFINSQTGHVSNVSPISQSTGVQSGQIIVVSGSGMQTVNSGGYGEDPQVDTIGVFRNTDGGEFFFQIAQFPNPGSSGSAGTWILSDIAPDDGITVTTTIEINGVPQAINEALNNEIYAPIGLLNSPPPAGLQNLEYFAGRMWGSVKNLLYYNTASDNAALINIEQNGVAAESWAGANVIPFNSPIVRSLAVGGGLMVFTTTDTWFVTGQNLLTGGFTPMKVLVNHGLRSYNAAGIDGSSVYLYTSDRQFLCINPNSGSVEFGFPIGDLLEQSFSPLNAYIVRHVAGSQDNAVFLADGSTGWYRLNPNQQGASLSGEQTPVWSPFASFSATIGGIGAIASIETSAGVIQLLVGQTTNGPVLVRNLSTFSDNGTPYSWSATIGSILLATSGKLAETESITTIMNNVASAATQCAVAVLLDEISGSFETLANSIPDPPQFTASTSILSQRFYLMQGTVAPVCQHIQIELSGTTATTKDEILAVVIRGALTPEQY